MARIIKRYENRKLYDTEARGYVSLEEIGRMVREGIDVQVIDKASDSDITAQTLTQVILEEGKRGRNPLSTEVLHDVLRWSNDLLGDGINTLRQKIDQFVPHSLNSLFNKENDSEDLEMLKQRVESLEEIIIKLNRESDRLTDENASEKPES